MHVAPQLNFELKTYTHSTPSLFWYDDVLLTNQDHEDFLVLAIFIE